MKFADKNVEMKFIAEMFSEYYREELRPAFLESFYMPVRSTFVGSGKANVYERLGRCVTGVLLLIVLLVVSSYLVYGALCMVAYPIVLLGTLLAGLWEVICAWL